MNLLDTVVQREPKIAEIFGRTQFSTRVADQLGLAIH
ncbi:MAG: hypothetical protein ACI82A_004516 [Candidatus Azotimanducaceae bacterium]|jgi:hypothetical protein